MQTTHTAQPSHRASALQIRRSEERGLADFGWLNSRHTFSFGEYYDPAWMGFRSLRVINQDRVAPGGGFPTHPHRDMEIFSYIISGSLRHRDSLGNGRDLRPGEIQLMSTGAGVTHSEFNPSSTEPVHFLQIWLKPRERGLQPRYTEWHPSAQTADAAQLLVISPDGREGSAEIAQDADIHRVRLAAGAAVEHTLRPGRGFWFQLISGTVEINGQTLQPGDAAFSEDPGSITLRATAAAEGLLFDLA